MAYKIDIDTNDSRMQNKKKKKRNSTSLIIHT